MSVPDAVSTRSDEPILTTRRLALDHSPLMAATLASRAPTSRGFLPSPRIALISRQSARNASFMPSPLAAETIKRRDARSLFQRARLFLHLVLRHGVGLRQRDDLGLVLEPRAISLHLAADDSIGLGRVVERGIDEMQQHGAALDMTEKAVADACAFMRAFDQPGNVGEHEVGVVDPAPRRDWDEAW